MRDGQSSVTIWSRSVLQYSIAVFCSAAVPRKSRPGPMHAQADPQASPYLSSSLFTKAGSMCEGSSMGISTVSKPHFLNVLKSRVLALVKGEVNKKVLMPNLILDFVTG